VQNVPNVRKAVKWNSPLHGIDGQGWFLGLHSRTTSRWRSSRHVVAISPAQRQQGQAHALHQHLQRRRVRRGADGEFGSIDWQGPHAISSICWGRSLKEAQASNRYEIRGPTPRQLTAG
jgi:hypothetical protein